MSKTDKTDPAWIQAAWEEGWVAEHVCNVAYGREVCDLPPEPPKHYDRTRPRLPRLIREFHCRWEPQMIGRYDYTLRYWRNASRGVAYVANQMERSIRTAWRMAERELLQVVPCRECGPGHNCYCDLDDVVLPDPRHRHFALWDRW